MEKYINREHLLQATDTEIKNFFEKTFFEGVFSHEIKSKKADFYKGCITDIKLEGHYTNIVSSFLNVPKTSNDIPEGPCRFKCRMNIASYRAGNTKYIVNLVGGSLSAKDSKEQELFEAWGVTNYECIGFYHYDEKIETYIVDDLRKPNFDHIPYYPGDKDKCPIKITYPHEIRGIKLNDYYLFTWKLSHKNRYNPYEIFIDFKNQPKAINPKWFINELLEDRLSDKSKNFGSTANFLDTLSKQLSAKESTFVYELLQNANDYPVEGQKVDVEFYITDNYLLFLHTGEKFNVRNISGICGINEKEKVANKHAIGYKGIGFKTVFLHNHYVYLQTGDYSFRFDEGETKLGGKIKRLGAPFQILPIWTEHNEVDQEVNNIFDASDNKFRVRIALRPEDKNILHVGRNCYENLFRDIFADANIILFIPNINSVRVFINGKEVRKCFRDSEKWVVNDYEEAIPFELQEKIDKTIDKGNSRIPEKYKGFDFTKISFACKHEGAFIKPIGDATLYCYLPTKASWGLPFLMNTDMIPKGDRNDIETEVKLIDEEETNFNEELAAIAGSKFFMWVKDLLTSKKYHLGSVFSLVPDFKKCKTEHKYYTKFIDKFAEAFDKCLESGQIVPVHQGIALVNINSVILDTTELSSSDIMGDADFLNFIGKKDCYLPLPVLRQDENFKTFLERYANDDQKFTKKDLTDLIVNEDFQEWLKVQENNDKFLRFLLDKDYLKDLLDKKLFLEDKGSLQTASALYYDLDKYLEDLQAFENHINFLSHKTREFFNGNEKWDKVVDGKFAEFNSKDFVDKNLLSQQNVKETIEKLKDKSTSIHFFKFLAENVEFSQAYKDLPYINNEGKPVNSFNSDFIFIESEEGKLQAQAKWLEDIPFSFISADYGEEVLNYFKNAQTEGNCKDPTPTFGVLDYDKSIIIKQVILNKKYAEKVNANQQKNDDAHKSFISFCYTNKDAFNAGSLKQYAIKVNEKNKDGEIRYELTEANVFFETPSYDAALAHPWIANDWLFSLSSDLLSTAISGETEQLKKFYKDAFGVKDLTAQLFYDEIVSKNIDAILKAKAKPTKENSDDEYSSEAIATAKKCNFDFVDYLNKNKDIVFKDKNFTKFNKLALLDYNGQFITNDSVIFFYNEELSNFMSKDWLPSNIVNMCSKNYGHSIALQEMRVDQKPRINKYDFATLYNLVIIPNLTTINKYLDKKNVNLDFHNSIISNIGAITLDDTKKISKAKVFIRGKKQPVETASGHKIVSKTVEELVGLSLVDYSELDLLDQDYHANEHQDYWQKALGNDSFTIKNFLDWLINQKESVATKLQDKTLNIKFWRWAKKNIKENASCLSGLPILLKGENAPREFPEEIYFSDEYLDTPIESLVTAVAPNTPILTSDYISIDEKKKEWVDFWTQLGVQQNEVEVLENVIRTRLSATKVANLVDLIYKNRTLLEPRFNDNLIGNLADIQLVGTDYKYHAAKDSVFVSRINDGDEPFPYISIPNRVGSLQADVNSFIGKIIQMHNPAHYVTDLHKWRQEKIEAYLALQGESKQTSVHMSLIKELAVLINANKDNLDALPKVSDILLLDKDNIYKPSKALTEGSKYNPFFDFEACGITLDYISDCYLSCGESVIKLFNYLKVHHDLEEKDLSYLSIYKTACYFWKNYLGSKNKDRRTKNIKHVTSFTTGSKNLFKVCVPTLEDKVVKAESLYSLHIRDKVALLTDGKKLLPLDIVAEGVLVDENSANKEGVYFMDKLPFKKMLSVQHCFDALCNIPIDIQTTKEKELRKELVKWIICQKDDNDISANLAKYRANENALWYNGTAQKQQVSKLYALNPNDNLEQYFGNNAKIIDASYVANKDNQLAAFKALGIKVISQTDVATVPSADKKPADNSNSIKKDLKFYTLIISGIESSESWKSSYEEYCSKVDKMEFWTCTAIEKKYKDDGNIVKKLSGFYHEGGKDDFYYKDNLNSPLVFLDYVKGVKEYLGLKADIEIIKNVMFNKQTACGLIENEYGRLLSDEKFVEEVRKTIPMFNYKEVMEPTTKPIVTDSITESINLTKTMFVNPPKVVEKPKEQEANKEESENTVRIGKADPNPLSQKEQIEAQLEAQKYLRSAKPMWIFPDNFAEVDENGKPYCFSTFHIKDEEGINRDIVLKSYKRNDVPFSINPEEWDSIMDRKAKILIYRGENIVEIEKEDLVKNQNSIVLRFSTENLDVEDKISQFSNILHYFKQIHFDFESFNISKRAKSIVGITNKNQGIQTGGSDDDI